MRFWSYYMLWLVLALLLREPWLLLGVVAFLLLRKLIPEPGALFRAARRMRALRAQVELNPANLTARRDLATIYLELRQPKKALSLIEAALTRAPQDAELLYLQGLALHRGGRHEEALAPLVRSVELNPRIRFGQPYRVAGDALSALSRWEAALDAYERYTETNSSDVAAYARLARVLVKLGDKRAAREATAEALRTFGVLPRGMKRRSLGGWLSTHWVRAWLLQEPVAIAAFAGTAALAATLVMALGPAMVTALSLPPAGHGMLGGAHDDESTAALYRAFQACGSQHTGSFAGRYELASVGPVGHLPPEQQRDMEEFARQRYANFVVHGDRITSGSQWTQELCLSRTSTLDDTTLEAEAVFHEDVHDPGDASLVRLRLHKEGGLVRFTLAPLEQSEDSWWLMLRPAGAPR